MKHLLIKFFAPIPGVGPNNWHPKIFYGKMAILVAALLAFLALLQAIPRQYRKWVIGAFTFLGGVYYVMEFFWPAGKESHNWLTDYNDLAANISNVVGGFAIGLGVISLLQLHIQTVARKRSGWGNSIALIVSFLAMTFFGLMNSYWPTAHVFGLAVFKSHPGNALFGITMHDVFEFLFIGGLNNLGSAMFSIIAFFIASAAYRAFRIRSWESSFLMLAALIIMLGSVSFGVALTGWIKDGEGIAPNFRIEHIAQWLMVQVNAPAQRGILFGLNVGALAVSLRLWLSLERGAYFDQEL